MSFFKHETAIVDSGATIGSGTKIWHFTHICAGAVIGDNCNIGQNVYIAANVVVGNNVKIQNGVSLYTGVTVEDWVFLGPHCTFTNDIFPRAYGEWKIIPTVLKSRCSVGANATILCGIVLGEGCMVGAGSVVTRNVPPYTLVYGNPAKFKKNIDI